MKQIIIDNISTSYYITKDGKCFNSNTNKYLKGQIGKNGYLSYNLTMPNGTKKRCYAHRLVGTAYIPNFDNNKTQINHINGDKLKNNIDNLEWCTPKENQEHAIKNSLRVFPEVYCFNKNKELVAKYASVREASIAAGISISIIQQELNKKIKALSGGFYWSREPKLGQVIEYKNLGKAKKVYQYTLDGKFVNSYESTGIAARSIGVKNGNHISECCREKIKSYKGFIWRYAEDIV